MNGYYTLYTVLLMLLVTGLSVASLIFWQQSLYFCLLFSVLSIGVLILLACRFQRQSTRTVLRMVESLRYNDFSLTFSTQRKNTQESKLRKEINEVVIGFRKQLSEQQERNQYNETLLDTVDCCLLVADKRQKIHWMNRAAINDLCGHSIHSLEELYILSKDFPELLRTIQPGEVKVIRLHKEDFIQEMAVTVTDYSSTDADLRLINLKNIRSVLEENEMEAWQKLIRVLTHEIMNSIAPIISLSETLTERAEQDEEEGHGSSVIVQGMQIIHRRSQGLLDFVKNYRQLSRLSAPILAPVRIGDLLGDIRKLHANNSMKYIYQIEDEEQMLMIDRAQMEQVLINLLKNAAEACEEQPHPEIVVSTQYQKEKQIFQLIVTDNGCGILPEVLDKIFVPFFTTKPKGSGIGLSLCKQIVNNHGGSISAISETNKGTSFVLKFLCKK